MYTCKVHLMYTCKVHLVYTCKPLFFVNPVSVCNCFYLVWASVCSQVPGVASVSPDLSRDPTAFGHTPSEICVTMVELLPPHGELVVLQMLSCSAPLANQ